MKYVGEKPKRRGRYLVHFEKVGILFRPKWLAIRFDEVRQQYALSYHSPEHLVRHYPSLNAAKNAAIRLQAKFHKLDTDLVLREGRFLGPIPIHAPPEKNDHDDTTRK